MRSASGRKRSPEIDKRAAKLVIAATWDGEAVPAEERAEIVLRRVAQGLSVSSDSPHHGDALPETPPGETPGLWDYEVLELFIAGPDGRYLEFEWGPAGHFLGLQLRAYREVESRFAALGMRVETRGARVHAHFLLPNGQLPPWPWTLNAYAIHGVGKTRRFLAAYPVGGPGISEPDFHRLSCFRPPPLGL